MDGTTRPAAVIKCVCGHTYRTRVRAASTRCPSCRTPRYVPASVPGRSALPGTPCYCPACGHGWNSRAKDGGRVRCPACGHGVRVHRPTSSARPTTTRGRSRPPEPDDDWSLDQADPPPPRPPKTPARRRAPRRKAPPRMGPIPPVTRAAIPPAVKAPPRKNGTTSRTPKLDTEWHYTPGMPIGPQPAPYGAPACEHCTGPVRTAGHYWVTGPPIGPTGKRLCWSHADSALRSPNTRIWRLAW